ncbi:hypothetical protein QBC45DRAFT_325239, partial [Copromyces sp. CBS 386.78]
INVFLASSNLSKEVRQAICDHQMFTNVAWTWSITLAKSNALDQGIASLGQTRTIINRLQALDNLKSDPALKQKGATIPLDNEVDVLASREWRFRQAAAKAYATLGQANGKYDIPLTQSDQKALANGLSLAAINESGMLDLKYHGKGKKKKLNYIVKRKRGLSALDVALFGWEASLALRGSHLGLSGGSCSINGLDIQPYQTHKERSDTLTKLFKISKASVMNIYSLPHLTRFASNPKSELHSDANADSDSDSDSDSGADADAGVRSNRGKKRPRTNNDNDSSNGNDEVDYQPRATKKARLQEGAIVQQAEFSQQDEFEHLAMEPAMPPDLPILPMPELVQQEHVDYQPNEANIEPPVSSEPALQPSATKEHGVAQNINPSDEDLVWLRDNVFLGAEPFPAQYNGSTASRAPEEEDGL